MKKILFIMAFLTVTVAVYSQDSVTTELPIVVRNGNKYTAGGDVMGKRAFLGFLQSRDALAYGTFRKGRTISKAGWALFGAGLGVTALIGLPITVSACSDMKTEKTDEASEIIGTMFTTPLQASFYYFGVIVMSVGATAATTGIVCLGVGYGMMHEAADIYNNNVRNRKTAVTFNLQSSSDGVGFAIRF